MGSLPRLGNSYSILVYQGIRNRLNLYHRLGILCEHCLCLKRHYQYQCHSSLHELRTANIDGEWVLKMPQMSFMHAGVIISLTMCYVHELCSEAYKNNFFQNAIGSTEAND